MDLPKRLVNAAVNRIRFDSSGYVASDMPAQKLSESALKSVDSIRGKDRPPVIILSGVMPRSGTGFVARLFRLHPDIESYPEEIWEMPVLHSLSPLIEYQNRFFNFYGRNREKMAENDLLAMHGAGFIGHLHAHSSADKIVFMKVPSVRYLHYFDTVFPREKCVVLVRDGRDVVSSYMKTWPRSNFAHACERWKLSADMALNSKSLFDDKSSVCMAKYEDAVSNPSEFITRVASELNLDMSQYPFESAEDVGVRGSSSMQEEGKVDWKLKERPADFNPIGRWSGWSVKEKSTFKKIAGETLMKLEYCKNLDW